MGDTPFSPFRGNTDTILRVLVCLCHCVSMCLSFIYITDLILKESVGSSFEERQCCGHISSLGREEQS